MIYLSIIHSPIIGEFDGPQPTLAHVAVTAVVKYLLFAGILIFVSGIRLVTWFLGVLLVLSIVEFFLALFRIGRFGVLSPDFNKLANPFLSELVPIAVYAAAFGTALYFLGI